jgi:tRNA threonylcarbamoyladenosine biosynthesis protein TsaE
MLALGKELAAIFKPGMVVFLHGELGAGKTTLTRGFLRALGYAGAVKSPTYTLVETYLFSSKNVHHFDLYRMKDPQEIIWMGLRDYMEPASICLIEWPEKGGEYLPEPNISVHIEFSDQARIVNIQQE